MNLTKELLTIPNPDPQGQSIVLKYDMLRVHEAEARVAEISFLSTSKAPELLTKLNLALQDLGNHLADLGYRESVAKRKMRERRAVVVIEIIPGKLAEKKLANNDTNREAVVDLDPEYSISSDVLSQIEAAFVLVREKLRSIESAINSAKKVLDTLPSHPNTSLVTYVGTSTGTNSFPQVDFPQVDQNFPDTNITTNINTNTTNTNTTRFEIGKVKYNGS